MESLAPPPPFKLNSNQVESWKLWKQRFQLYMDATLLNAKPESQKRDITYERQKLFLLVQREGQSVDDVITELRRQLRNYDYGSLTDSVLVDQLVRGLRESRLRESLLRIPDLDIKKAVDMCCAAETSKLQVQVYFTEERCIDAIKRFKPSSEVKPRATGQANKFRQPAKRQESSRRKCQYCGSHHVPGSCPAYGKQCRSCGKQNHYSRVCKLKSVNRVCENSPEEFPNSANSSRGKPIAFALSTLTPAQRNYAHMEKELLAVVYGCKKFHQYVYGTTFKIYSDKKPLIAMSIKPLSAMSSRMQRFYMQLQYYDYEIFYKPGKEMFVSDTLSRAPLIKNHFPTPEEVSLVLSVLDSLPISDIKLQEISDANKSDPIVQELKPLLQCGWDSSKGVSLSAKKYLQYEDELHFVVDLLLKLDLIVVPESMRREILNRLHEGHFGIVKTISMARTCVFWPGISEDIKEMLDKRPVCAKFQIGNAPEPEMPHEFPTLPWVKVAIDFFYFNGKHYVENFTDSEEYSTNDAIPESTPIVRPQELVDESASDSQSSQESSSYDPISRSPDKGPYRTRYGRVVKPPSRYVAKF
ncbi:hypothetical protein AVEN_206091-1 [Araneus ventricosus]|uniref:RNA-directed DNA polymerase n=1 Tax=Araneus ventricosus TaxID=182803 RepID=A0A4Y2N7V9_ARAVE|nr:hypothetical protein AVEN_206091-1 [Araneus ventricosus]